MALQPLADEAGGRTLGQFEQTLGTASCDLFARFQQSRTNDEDAREPLTRRDEEKMESSGEDEDTEVAAAFDQPSSPRSEPGAVCPSLKRKAATTKNRGSEPKRRRLKCFRRVYLP